MANLPTAQGFIDALRILLPDGRDTLLLRFCLLDRDAAAAAWSSWTQMVGDPRQALEADQRGLKGLLPLINDSIARSGVDVPDGLRTYLRAAAFREELRWGAIETILARLVKTFADKGVQFVLIGGAGVAVTAYREPAHRHCHELRLYVGKTTSGVASALAEAGFNRAHVQDRSPTTETFEHRDGLPLRLMRDLADHPCYANEGSDVVARSIPVEVGGEIVRVASPTDQLVAILSQASTSRHRANLRWACDAWLTIAAARVIDWDRFVTQVAHRRLSLAAATMCSYLRADLHAEIPEPVIAELESASRRTGRLERDAALAGALQGLSSTRSFMGLADWQTRLEAVRFLLFPSRACLAWTYGDKSVWRWPIRYVQRPLRYAISRLARSVKSLRSP